MKILAIETSCDETSVSVLKCKGGFKNPSFNILSNIVLSQVDIHKIFGGVVPNLAKREHQKNLVPVLIQALREAELLKLKIKIKDLKLLNKILERETELLKESLRFLEKYENPKIDLIAVTNGPGLEPALWVGVNFGRAMSQAWQIPVLGVNHLEGHIYSVLLKQNRVKKLEVALPTSKIQFPALALVVSGGHTELVLMEEWLNYKIIGSTLDDAAGEAFDKAARILGLGYPGGPIISREAEKNIFTMSDIVRLPRPMINSKDFNFSFSGLKTAVLYLVQNLKKSGKWSEELIPQVAYEFQEAVLDVLISKSLKAAEKYSVKTFILCGGVSANKELRKRLAEKISEKFNKKVKFLMPDIEFSGDNAAMIAVSAYFNYLNLKVEEKLPKITPVIKVNGNLNF